ncbi:MAG: 16S rRNA (adenine(1518)-N(6)/adenine(1519)-N(6))-dimethyltransferase RsmA, partial [Desulfobulbaceae bacterium]|nr:16S rRNA (adenine(1518)-N(6)/adenine(1519)-N(6))-dimethyltransferase RsmA [Desulfobulbaceae bacterium]
MPDRPTIKDILKDQKLAPNKKLGQNFLVHKQTPIMIVERSGVGNDDTVVELGVGLGSLTVPLASKVKKVIGIELDSGIIKWQRESGNLPNNVELIHQDLLKADYVDLADKCGSKLKIMANLPYSISNPLLFKLIDNQQVMGWAVLMLQKEVAQRLTAQVGSKEYGILSILLGACASVETLLTVGPEQFHPRPNVDSQVVKIVFDPVPE